MPWTQFIENIHHWSLTTNQRSCDMSHPVSSLKTALLLILCKSNQWNHTFCGHYYKICNSKVSVWTLSMRKIDIKKNSDKSVRCVNLWKTQTTRKLGGLWRIILFYKMHFIRTNVDSTDWLTLLRHDILETWVTEIKFQNRKSLSETKCLTGITFKETFNSTVLTPLIAVNIYVNISHKSL